MICYSNVMFVPVWNEGNVHSTCAVHKGRSWCTKAALGAQIGAQATSGVHHIFELACIYMICSYSIMQFTLKYKIKYRKNNSTRIEQLNKSYKWQILDLVIRLRC